MKTEEFEELRQLAIEKTKPNTHGRFCIKEQMMTTLEKLDSEKCVSCDEFILNGGNCDPI